MEPAQRHWGSLDLNQSMVVSQQETEHLQRNCDEAEEGRSFLCQMLMAGKLDWQESRTSNKQEARSPRVAQDTETNSGVQGLETGCRFSSIYWPPCKLLFKSAVVQTKRPALLGSAKRVLKNSDSHLAELIMRPQADQIGADSKVIGVVA